MKKQLQQFAESLWPGPPVVEVTLFDSPDPESILGGLVTVDDIAFIVLYPIVIQGLSHWVTVLHELAHLAHGQKYPEDQESHGLSWWREYRRLLHRAVVIYREDLLRDVIVEAVKEIIFYRAEHPAKEPKPAPCRFWFHPPMRPRSWYKRLYSYLLKYY